MSNHFIKRKTTPIHPADAGFHKSNSLHEFDRQVTEPHGAGAARPFRLFSENKFVIPRLRDMGAVKSVNNADKSRMSDSTHRITQGVQLAGCRTVQAQKGNKILAIETSGSTFSLALAERERLIAEVFWYSGLAHSERLVPALDRLMSDAGWKLEEISTIVVSTGPGSFTGIRVGISCARTLAQTLALPLTGMTTLDLLTTAVPCGPYRIVPIIDALRGEVFTVNGNGESIIAAIPELKHLFNKQKEMLLFVGNAVATYQEDISKLFGKKALFPNPYLNVPRAGVLALSARKLKSHPYSRIHPLYIRRSWAEEKQKNP